MSRIRRVVPSCTGIPSRRWSTRFVLISGWIAWWASASVAGAADVLVKAVMGQPYGVAAVELPIGVPVPGQEYSPIEVSDDAGRVLFPVASDVRIEIGLPSERPLPPIGGGRLLGRVGDLVKELAGDDSARYQTVARRALFLFSGSQPIRVRVRDVDESFGTYEVVPEADPEAHPELLRQWWTAYTQTARAQMEVADYPTVVESYLIAMLSGRTGMPLPEWYFDTKQGDDQLLNTLKLIGGAEDISDAVFRFAAAGVSSRDAVANLPLPSPPNWTPIEVPDDVDAVTVEPLAQRVPPECFYIRYGSFENFLWFRDLSEEHGGDISRMVTLRGIQHNAMLRIEDQLAMKMTQMARLLGGSIIEDQAVIGRDLFMTDGASIGVVIKSKNMFLLQTSVNADRRRIASEDPAVTLKDIKVGGRPASLLSSADHRVRSFVGIDGEYMLVTNSRSILERFYEVGQSGQSLAATPSFRLARRFMPLDREDTIFAYFSPQMLQGLIAPQYMIELRRRLFAKAELTMVRLARLVAPQQVDSQLGRLSIDDLVGLGFLPKNFGDRPDGSGAFEIGNEVIDSLRGTRRSFLPIADVDVQSVTRHESDWYEAIAQAYSERFTNFDPLMVGVQRQVLEGGTGLERITVHAEIAPWDPGKYGKLAEQLGPPTSTVMQFSPDDIVTAQAHVASPWLGPQTHLFAAIKDSRPPDPAQFEGILNAYFSLKQIPGYLGAWPQPGALDRLPLGLGEGQPVGPGMTRLIGGVYRYTDGKFSVVSFQPEVLQASLPHLAAVDSEDPAQVRLHIGNLSGSQLQDWVNAQLYERAKKTSVAGADYLSMLSRQLRIEPDKVMTVAEEILAAKMQCTLGGSYEPSTESAGRWISTAWNGQSPPDDPPPDYLSPLLKWFRGADARLTQFDDRVVADAVLEMARQ